MRIAMLAGCTLAFEYVGTCVRNLAKYVIQPAGYKTDQKPDGVFRFIYFRRCDGFYRNAVAESIEV